MLFYLTNTLMMLIFIRQSHLLKNFVKSSFIVIGNHKGSEQLMLKHSKSFGGEMGQ